MEKKTPVQKADLAPQRYSSTVAKALDLIERMADLEGAASVKEMSERFKAEKASVYRIVNTLHRLGYVYKEGPRYRLTTRFVGLASKILRRIDLRPIVRPFLEDLARKAQEACMLTVVEGEEAVIIDKVEGNPSLRIFSDIGSRFPLDCTASGQVYLAHLGEQGDKMVDEMDLRAVGPNTIVDRAELKKKLRQIREIGYSFCHLEHDAVKNTLAAPIYDHGHRIVGMLLIAGAATSLTGDKAQQIVPSLLKATREISRRI